MDTTVPVSKLKAEALSIVERVSSTGEEITITKRGKPVARLVPFEQPRDLLGSVRLLVTEQEFLAPIPQQWEAEA